MTLRSPKTLSMQIVISLLLFLGVGLLCLLLVGENAIRMTDETAAARQQRFAARNLAAEIEKLPVQQNSSTIWDDAVRRTEARDLDWMDANLGIWMQDYFGHDESYVLDQDDMPIYAAISSQRSAPYLYSERADVIAPLVVQLRAQMAAASDGLDNPYEELGELSVVGPVTFATEAAIVSVVPIVSDTGLVSQSPGTENLHVAVQYLDAALAAHIGAPVELDDLAFGTTPPGQGRAGIPVTDPAGADIAWLTWQPEQPGMSLLFRMLPTLLILMLLGTAMFWWVVQRLLRVSGQLQVSEAQARFLAHHDALTGLPNRILFQDRLAEAMLGIGADRTSLALVAIDLDRFKLINDALGHPAGDELIRQVGNRLVVDLVRASDTVARFGGDEFMILLRDVPDDNHLRQFCARIVENLSHPYSLLGNSGCIGASAGAVRAARPDEDRDELIRRADIALYEAKAEGKGRYSLFGADMGQIAERRNQIEFDLRAALDAGTGLSLVYQPFYNDAGRIAGAEALCRWTHPEHGALSPEIFIKVAEERGLIDQLGQQVLEMACRFATGTNLKKIAVNVSPMQLRSADFVPMVLRTLEETGLSATRLELELTERVLLEQSVEIREKIRALRSAGIMIALDDFGTGNSSLQYLRDHRVDSVKIDRSFVARLGKDEECDHLVRAILELARAMGISVTVEGVENEAQYERLTAMGCKAFQGYLLHRPMDPQRFASMLVNETTDSVASA